MADPVERAERAVSALIRLGISAVLPLWALLMIVLGVEYRSLWWLGTGIAVGAVGVLFLAGSPLANLFSSDR
jgi:TRAP-type mannitol/chloroaromatic compound transport system permease large subunit